MNQIIANGKLFHENGNDYIKFDCGETYYTGLIKPDMFPKELLHNLHETIYKSFTGHMDDEIQVTGQFLKDDLTINNEYLMTINIKNKFFSFENMFSISLVCNAKDKLDYLEEKLNLMNEKISILEQLVMAKNNNPELISQESSDDSDQSDDEVDKKAKNKVNQSKAQKNMRKK
jgi:hypothetical protein